MKFWEKLKTEGKIYFTASRKSATGTGGGPSTIKVDPIMEQVCSIMGRGCSGIENVADCDSEQLTLAVPEYVPLPDLEPMGQEEIRVLRDLENAEIVSCKK